MRLALGAALAALGVMGAQLAACAAGNETEDPATTTGGEGGSATTTGQGGAGGDGGGACVPADEVCDGADNDCDGEVDEGCECFAGDTQPCYSGPNGTSGVGACKPGMQACDTQTNTFGPCQGEVLPAAGETCNGTDDDCDGLVDDAIPDLTCGVGACAATAPGCVGGAPAACTPGSPSTEVCDGIDNDCDQLTDESFPGQGSACDSGIPGACAAGTLACITAMPTCVPNLMPAPETCDGIDNDCNGLVDDAIPGTGGSCSTGSPGVCSAGAIQCQGGSIDCFPIVPSSPEVCDGLDNDCDGTVDDGNPGGGGACATGQPGVCGPGTLACSGGSVQCLPNALGSPEVCDGLDNNCDGQVDEGNPGGGGACSCGGTLNCSGGGLVCQNCTIEVQCSGGLDDDNDGPVDCADNDCALGCGANAMVCGAGQTLLVYKSTDLPKSIIDYTTATSVLTVSNVGAIKRVRAQVNLTHTYDGDLTIALESPNGPTVDLSSSNGSSGDNYTNTIFDGTCATPITSGSAPFNGCYQPEASLSAMDNLPANGVWTLTVADGLGGDSGTLSAWSIALCVQ